MDNQSPFFIFKRNKNEKIKVMFTVKMVVGENVMNVGTTNCSTEAELMLRAVTENGSEAWICNNIDEIMVG